MSLEEETTETEEDEPLVSQEIKFIAKDLLDGKLPGGMEEMLAEISIIDALARYHGWPDERVREIYSISMFHSDGIWDVIVEPKNV